MPEPRTDHSFADALRPFQRRLQLVWAVESLPIAGALAVPIAGAIVLVVRPGALAGAAILAAGVLAGALLVMAIAIALPPSLDRTATTVDRRYGLEEHAVTALQFAQATDPVSQRVVADARTQLARVDPRQLAPSIPAHGLWIASAAAVSVVATLLMARPAVDTRAASIDAVRDAGAGAAAARASSAPKAAAAKRVAAAAAASGPATAVTGTEPRLQTAPLERTSRESSAPSEPATSGKDDRGERGAAGRGEAGGPGAESPSAPSSISAADDRAAGAAASGSSRPGGAGAGGSTAARTGTQAGGVSSGALLARTAAVSTQVPRDSMTEAEYQRAVAQAESAIAQQRVPAQLRSYVRDYFLSLRQGAAR